MSIPIDTILNSVASAVTGLNLTLNSQSVPVVVRKDGKRQTIDPSTLIIVSKKPIPERRKHYTSSDGPGNKGYDMVTMDVQCTFLAPNNDDQSTNLGGYASIRDSIEEKFRTREQAALSPPNGYGYRNVRSVPGSFLPVDAIMNNYDYQNVDIELEIISPK